jgi:hypothetical protein
MRSCASPVSYFRDGRISRGFGDPRRLLRLTPGFGVSKIALFSPRAAETARDVADMVAFLPVMGTGKVASAKVHPVVVFNICDRCASAPRSRLAHHFRVSPSRAPSPDDRSPPPTPAATSAARRRRSA